LIKNECFKKDIHILSRKNILFTEYYLFLRKTIEIFACRTDRISLNDSPNKLNSFFTAKDKKGDSDLTEIYGVYFTSKHFLTC
jgi:hypothetical protein